MKPVVTLFARRVLLGLVLLMGIGCGSTNRLHEVDFEDARVAVVANIPPRPVVFTDVLYEARIDPDDPVGSIFRAGTAIAKQAEAGCWPRTRSSGKDVWTGWAPTRRG